jgi:antitoxin (DNA-binding transcriptional repressor) of toxin-antitoxin stability system
MKTITATELARNLRRVLDSVVSEGEEIVIERNHEQIARLVAGPGRQNALEAIADLYRTLPDEVAATLGKRCQSIALTSTDPRPNTRLISRRRS